MKIRIFVLLVMAVAFLSCSDDITYYTDFGWDAQDLSDKVIDINSLFFLDTLNGWAAGGYSSLSGDVDDYGKVFHTSDGGINWEEQIKLDKNYFYKVYFINSSTGFVLGKSGKLLRTSDGGANWDSIPLNEYNNLRSIAFVDDKIGWLVGTYGTLMRTTDAGLTWERFFLESTHWMDITFKGYVGYLIGGTSEQGYTTGKIFKTVNGGLLWDSVYYNNNFLFRKCNFVDSENGWITGNNGFMIRTTDAGHSWEELSTKAKYHLNSVCFSDKMNGWTCGREGQILNTTNGGISWSEQMTGKPREHFNDIIFLDSLHGWMSGTYGTILYTNLGGKDIKSK